MLQILPSSPTELGFPAKYDQWRNNQAELIEHTLMCEKRVVANCAPTGFGKSQCYMTEAVMNGGRVAIVTQTKGMQDQLLHDYGSMGVADIRGKDNYSCPSRPGWTCKDGHVGGCSLKGGPECGATRAYNAARASRIVSTNFKFWIASHKYGTGLGNFSKVIFDEADNCPDELADSVTVKLSYNEIENMLETVFSHPNSTGDSWKTWAGLTAGIAKKKTLEKKAQIDSNKVVKPSWIKDYHHLKNLTQKLATVALMRASEWLWEEFDWGWQFDPVKFSRYAESRLFFKIPKITMFSATIRRKTCHILNIGDDDMDFIDHPSVFDPAKSPVYYLPTMRVDMNNQDISVLSMRMDQFMRPRLQLGRNGVIHVTSFAYRDKVVRGSDYRTHMVSHWDKSPVAEAVERFRQQGGVFVTPSASTGYNFTDDMCRFQLITKLPFEPSTKIVKARQELDPTYSPYQTVRKLVQQCGRGTRSEEDWCENIVFDSHCDWFIPRYGSISQRGINPYLAPLSFLERWKTISTLPPVYQP